MDEPRARPYAGMNLSPEFVFIIVPQVIKHA